MRKARDPNRRDVVRVPDPANAATAGEEQRPARKTKSARDVSAVKNKPPRVRTDEEKSAAPVADSASFSTLPQAGNGQCRHEQALRAIRRHTLAAGGAGFIPLPGADVLGMTALQANLIEDLSKIYGFTPTPGWSLRLAGLFAFSASGSAAGSVLASSLAKLVPGLGTILGVGSLAAYGAASTCALGYGIMHHYECGGRPEHLVCSSFWRAVREGMDKGGKKWREWLAQAE